MTRPYNRFSTPELAAIAREFIAMQAPDLPMLRKSNSHEGKALRAYEAQRPVGARAFAKIKTGEWLELRSKDGPNRLVFVTHVGGMKRTPAVHAAPARQERALHTTSERIWCDSVVAVHNAHPHRTRGAPYALLADLAKAFAAKTCSAERDPNAGTYFELVLGDARAWTWTATKETMLSALRSAGFRNAAMIRHTRTGVPQWYAEGKDYNARVRLCGTSTTARMEVDFVQRHKSAFRRK